MPYQLDTHVLTVDANVIHKVDTANPANLYSMWTVFSRCADSVDQGRRLENLSWRLWQKEQLVETEQVTDTASSCSQSNPRNIPSNLSFNDLPQLSGSIESLADADETIELTSVSVPLDITRPRILRQDSASSSRSRRERSHTSSDDFEKMIVSIVKDKAPLSAPAPSALTMSIQKNIDIPVAPSTIQRSGSTTTESQSPTKSDAHSDDSQSSPAMQPRTTVVRGFSPSHLPIDHLQRPKIGLTTDKCLPEPKSNPAPKNVMAKKQPVAFALGGSCSSSEAGQSFETRKPLASALKKASFRLGGSSEEEGSLKSALSPRGMSRLAQKKQASFSSRITTVTMDPDSAIESDSDYIDESAIDDDDDSSDWEDSNEESSKLSVDDKYFQRVDSKANLTSRRSLITLMLAQNDDGRKIGNLASQSTSALHQARNTRQPLSPDVSPNDSDESPLMMKSRAQAPLRPIREIPRTAAQPIATTSHGHAQACLSPRTTRRNMLATELTESLRRHLLWERSQKSSTANAVLKRRHTAQDVQNLKQYPEKCCMKRSEDDNEGSWNQYFQKETHDGYHSKGW